MPHLTYKLKSQEDRGLWIDIRCGNDGSDHQ